MAINLDAKKIRSLAQWQKSETTGAAIGSGNARCGGRSARQVNFGSGEKGEEFSWGRTFVGAIQFVVEEKAGGLGWERPSPAEANGVYVVFAIVCACR